MKSETRNGIPAFYARSQKEWRSWLTRNVGKLKSVWLIIYKKDSGIPSITYKEAVDEALCFGWIDSKPNKRDSKSFYQYFARRNPSSKWSKINKARVEQLIKENRMQKSGFEAIELARQNGTWDALDDVDNSVIPPDLQRALEANKSALKNFLGFPRSSKKIILEWIANAKKVETRMKRIEETVGMAAKNMRAHHFRQ